MVFLPCWNLLRRSYIYAAGVLVSLDEDLYNPMITELLTV